jgi:hypothetical protein
MRGIRRRLRRVELLLRDSSFFRRTRQRSRSPAVRARAVSAAWTLARATATCARAFWTAPSAVSAFDWRSRVSIVSRVCPFSTGWLSSTAIDVT